MVEVSVITPVAPGKGLSADWALPILGLSALAVLALYWPTAVTMVDQWRTSSAYSYGFLIIPIALYLVWRDRARLDGLVPEPAVAGIAVAAAFAAAWLAADFLWIAEGRHIALVGLLEALLFAVLGWRIFRVLLFPLMFLWLMVPTGTFLLEPLQRLSHAGALVLIKLSGIPVFAEGTLIQVPEGHFIVEPGCAGLNFLLTALVLSLLFGKLNYRTWSARAICVAVALATSLIANILRIYLIIVLTQITHRQFDIADDHLLYGWGFFGVIMMAMMWWGARFAAPDEARIPAETRPARQGGGLNAGLAAAAVVFVAGLPVAISTATAGAAASVGTAFTLPAEIGPWRKLESVSEQADWRPAVGPGAAIGENTYGWDKWRADVAVAFYSAQAGGREAASGDNRAAAAPWEAMGTTPLTVPAQTASYDVTRVALRSGDNERIVLTWYQSGDCITASRLRAKLCATRARLSGHPAPGAFVAVSAEPGADPAATQSILTELARAVLVSGAVHVSAE